jgi:tetratricopeptide (TPR) repeat protein
MRRGGWVGGGLFLLVAVLWSALDPALAYRDVEALCRPGADRAGAEAALLGRGRASLRALRSGLGSPDAETRLRCARLLALAGESEGEDVLLGALGGEADDGRAALAEHLLLSLWDDRKGPPSNRAATVLGEPPPEHALLERRERELDLLLTMHPAWAGGYAARARLHLLLDEPRLAAKDAAAALFLEPNHFETMVLLARIYRRLGNSEQALAFMERAVRLCPRLEREVGPEWEKLRDAVQTERERRLKERRYERPLI